MRWRAGTRLGLVLVIWAEVLYLRSRFAYAALVDAGVAPETGPLYRARTLIPGGVTGIVLATLAMLLVASGPETRRRLKAFGRDFLAAPLSWRWGAVHAGLALATVLALNAFASSAPASLLYLVAGFALALAAAAVWVPALMPLPTWRAHVPTLAPMIGLAALAGIAAGMLGVVSQMAFWDPLTPLTFRATGALLGLVTKVQVDPERLRILLPHFRVRVEIACAGYEGIGLSFGVMTAYVLASRRKLRFPQAFAIPCMAGLIAAIVNPFRIAALLLIGEFWSKPLAIGGFHSNLGWLLASLTALLTLWLASRLPWVWREGERPSQADEFPAAPYLVPLMLVLIATLASRMVASDLDWLYPVRVAVAAAALWWWRGVYRNLLRGLTWVGPVAGALVFLVWMGTSHLSETTAAGAALKAALAALSPALALAWIAAKVAGAVVTAPLVEELAFRGFLYRYLIARDFAAVPMSRVAPLALAVSSVAFGMMHGHKVLGTVAGLAFAAAMLRRGRFGDAVVAHVVCNGLVAGYVLITGDFSPWC